MYKLFRPLIFLLPPEAAHALSLWYLKVFSGLFSTPEDPILKTTVAGLDFKTPVGLAAGYDKDARIPKQILKTGFGFAEVGTITPRPQPGNPKPRIFRLTRDQAVINRLGFNNRGFDAALAELGKFPKGKRQGVVGINIGANKDARDPIEDYVKGIGVFKGAADYFTINISSPNTPGLRDLQTRARFSALVKKAKKALAVQKQTPPLFIKVAPDLEPGQLGAIVEIAMDQKVDGLIISNTTVSRPKGLKSLKKTESGGLSGQPLFDPSTRLLAKAYRLSGGKLVLIGAGGVASAEQAFQKILNGASLVQLYTGLVYEGPGLVRAISEGLAELLREGGFTSVSQAVGKAIKL